MVGPVVKINAGGAAGSGTGIGIKIPGLPRLADAAKAGAVVEAGKANPTWLELNLHHSNLEPVAGASYRADFADGSSREGVLDGKGFARLEDVPPGRLKFITAKIHDSLIVSRSRLLRAPMKGSIQTCENLD